MSVAERRCWPVDMVDRGSRENSRVALARARRYFPTISHPDVRIGISPLILASDLSLHVPRSFSELSAANRTRGDGHEGNKAECRG